jgi:hypothetical protein
MLYDMVYDMLSQQCFVTSQSSLQSTSQLVELVLGRQCSELYC